MGPAVFSVGAGKEQVIPRRGSRVDIGGILGELIRLRSFKQFSLPKDREKRKREQLNDREEKTAIKTALK